MLFGDRLKILREDKDITQKDLGSIVGVSARVIGYYESNDRFPKDEKTLKSLADYFNVTVDFLLGRESDNHQTSSTDKHDELSSKEKIVIENEAKQMIDNIKDAKVVEFCGTPADEDDLEFLEDAYKRFLEDVRRYNKIKYNPNKNKK